jgi:hypothetical protein
MPKPELMHVRPGKTALPITAQRARKLADDAARLRAGTTTALGVGVAGAIAIYSALKDRELKGGKKSSYVNMAEKENEGEERKARDRANDDPMMSGKDALGKTSTTPPVKPKKSSSRSPVKRPKNREEGEKPSVGLSGSIASQLKNNAGTTMEQNAPFKKRKSSKKVSDLSGDLSSPPDTSSFRKVSGPDGLKQGIRVYKTPFGNITVDSTDEGMWGKGEDGLPRTSEDAANFKKGGTAKKKKAVSKYGAKAMKFTNRGGMYKVKR